MASKKEGNGSRERAGYKASLKVGFKDLALDIPIRYEKISSKDIQEQINIVSKASDGEVVESKYVMCDVNDPMRDASADVAKIAEKKKVYLGTTNGKIYTKDEVRDYQILEDASEVEVSAPTETTRAFDVNDTRPLDSFDNYLAESEYEVYADNGDLSSLKNLADYLVANNICLMFDFQRSNTHKPMKGILKPVFEDGGKWTLVMRLTMTKYTFKHLNEPTITTQQVKATQRAKVTLAV